jgi:hypothetical protein
MSKEQAEKKVAEMFQERLDTNAEYQRLQCKVYSVGLVKTAANENKYRGEISGFAGQYRLSVSVIADKDAVLCEPEPAALVVLSGAIERADALKAEMKADAEKKTSIAVQDHLDAKYSVLVMKVRSAQLAETENGAYEGAVNVWISGIDCPLGVTVAGDDVQYEISPEDIAALDRFKEAADAFLARGIGEYLGTWSRNDWYDRDFAYTISAEKVVMKGDNYPTPNGICYLEIKRMPMTRLAMHCTAAFFNSFCIKPTVPRY